MLVLFYIILVKFKLLDFSKKQELHSFVDGGSMLLSLPHMHVYPPHATATLAHPSLQQLLCLHTHPRMLVHNRSKLI
jgi:hypothetical protein